MYDYIQIIYQIPIPRCDVVMLKSSLSTAQHAWTEQSKLHETTDQSTFSDCKRTCFNKENLPFTNIFVLMAVPLYLRNYTKCAFQTFPVGRSLSGYTTFLTVHPLPLFTFSFAPADNLKMMDVQLTEGCHIWKAKIVSCFMQLWPLCSFVVGGEGELPLSGVAMSHLGTLMW